MYTITGYDASAHISEETHGAEHASAQGVWRSVFYSAVFGWIVLLAITFASRSHEADIYKAGFPALAIFTSALSSAGDKAVVLISTVGQLFCGMACIDERLAHDVRVLTRRRRPRAQPVAAAGRSKTPTWAVFFVVVFALDHHDPGLLPEQRRARRSRSSRSRRSR